MNDQNLDPDTRQAFIRSYNNNLNDFLEAQEHSNEDNVLSEDIEITTDLGNSTTAFTASTSGLLSPDKPSSHPSLQDQIIPKKVEKSEEAQYSSFTSDSEKKGTEDVNGSEDHGIKVDNARNENASPSVRFAHFDTPIPEEERHNVVQNSSDEITVHNIDSNSSDSLDTDALKKLAGLEASDDVVTKDSTAIPSKSFTVARDDSDLKATNVENDLNRNLESTRKDCSNLIDKGKSQFLLSNSSITCR